MGKSIKSIIVEELYIEVLRVNLRRRRPFHNLYVRGRNERNAHTFVRCQVSNLCGWYPPDGEGCDDRNATVAPGQKVRKKTLSIVHTIENAQRTNISKALGKSSVTCQMGEPCKRQLRDESNIPWKDKKRICAWYCKRPARHEIYVALFYWELPSPIFW